MTAYIFVYIFCIQNLTGDFLYIQNVTGEILFVQKNTGEILYVQKCHGCFVVDQSNYFAIIVVGVDSVFFYSKSNMQLSSRHV